MSVGRAIDDVCFKINAVHSAVRSVSLPLVPLEDTSSRKEAILYLGCGVSSREDENDESGNQKGMLDVN